MIGFVKEMFEISKKNILKLVLTLVILLLIVSSIIIAMKIRKINEEKAFSKKLNDEVDKYAEILKFNGDILVANKGKVLVYKAYGVSNKEKQVPNTTDTKFLIGSITKQFTALSIMQLEEKGLLNVNDNIDKYMPGFPHGKEITIHQLLSHTSGLQRDFLEQIEASDVAAETLNIVKKI